jgi:SAM-dependent methyltransferase
MSDENAIAAHWGRGDVYARIVSALEQASKSLDALTVQDLAPVDQIHAGGLLTTIDLGDSLPIKPCQHVLDIGCGLGGPARYFAQRFQCRVSGIDITKPFVEAANKLTHLLGMDDRVTVGYGDGHQLPYKDGVFDGAYTQHVTMNVPDRAQFFAEAYRVLKPGAFFAITEHGLGPRWGLHYPLAWSEDGSGSYLVSPVETRRFLEAAGFAEIVMKHTGSTHLAAYKRGMEMAARGAVPPLGVHILMGETASQKTRNAARNIEEGRTHPVRVVCRKPV